jgi:hypothetical protein
MQHGWSKLRLDSWCRFGNLIVAASHQCADSVFMPLPMPSTILLNKTFSAPRTIARYAKFGVPAARSNVGGKCVGHPGSSLRAHVVSLE